MSAKMICNKKQCRDLILFTIQKQNKMRQKRTETPKTIPKKKKRKEYKQNTRNKIFVLYRMCIQLYFIFHIILITMNISYHIPHHVSYNVSQTSYEPFSMRCSNLLHIVLYFIFHIIFRVIFHIIFLATCHVIFHKPHTCPFP